MAKTVSWMWKGKRYYGTLIRETATHKYARTKSGKNSEILVKKIINNDKVQNLGSLANPESVIEYRKININE